MDYLSHYYNKKIGFMQEIFQKFPLNDNNSNFLENLNFYLQKCSNKIE